MTIELADNIDIISISESTGIIYLTISDHLNWEHPAKAVILQNKINRYLEFIESGQMAMQNPQAAPLNPVISLVSQHPANKSFGPFLTKIQAIIEEAGYSFECNSFDAKSNQLIENKEIK